MGGVFFIGGIMENVIVVDKAIKRVKETKRELEKLEIELYKLKAQTLEEEEMDLNEAEKIIKEAEKLYKGGRGLSIEEFKRELGL